MLAAPEYREEWIVSGSRRGIVRGFFPSFSLLFFQEPIKSRAPQLHLEYRFYKQLGSSGKKLSSHCNAHSICVYLYTYILYTSLRLTLCLFGSPP